MMRRNPFVLAATLAVTLSAGSALAQEPLDVDGPPPSPPAAAGTEQAVVARYWELGRPRLFFASTVEAGYAYARPKFALGYGLPFWSWVGLQAWPLVSLSSVGGYAGLAAAIPGVSLRAGARYTYPFSQSFLEPDDSYSRLELEDTSGPRAEYIALEAEASGTVPAPGGSIFAVLTGYRTLLVPEGYFLFEESLRAVMAPPYIWRARLGYLFAFGRDAAVRIGPAADLIGLPEREAYIVRGGVLASVAVTAAIEAQASFIPVIVSPDNLGIAGGDFGQLGVRYHWATDSTPDPEKVRRAHEERLRELRARTPRDAR